MGVRNCKDIGENLKKIINRLMANDNLVNLLYYTSSDPLNCTPLTEDQKASLIFNKLIRLVPKVNDIEIEHSILSVRVLEANQLSENGEFKNVTIGIEVFIPWNQWLIKDANLRPFAILGEIQSSLQNKTINGLGKMVGGNFRLSYNTNDILCYQQIFNIISYD